MIGQPQISGVYRLGQQDDNRDPLEHWGRMEKMRRLAWQRCGIVAVNPNDLPLALAAELRAWAEDNYGKR